MVGNRPLERDLDLVLVGTLELLGGESFSVRAGDLLAARALAGLLADLRGELLFA